MKLSFVLATGCGELNHLNGEIPGVVGSPPSFVTGDIIAQSS
jgi:hypothetical protein